MINPEEIWKLSSDLYHRGHRLVPWVLKMTNYFVFRALLPPEVKVGAHLRLDHWALGVVAHPQVEIGDDCRIYHHVTLAAETWLGSPFKIIVGNNVTIGAHTIVVARQNTTLAIGEGSYIGAGSVLTKDVPAFEMWAGNPARKLGETVPGQAGSRGQYVRGPARKCPKQEPRGTAFSEQNSDHRLQNLD